MPHVLPSCLGRIIDNSSKTSTPMSAAFKLIISLNAANAKLFRPSFVFNLLSESRDGGDVRTTTLNPFRWETSSSSANDSTNRQIPVDIVTARPRVDKSCAPVYTNTKSFSFKVRFLSDKILPNSSENAFQV